MWYGLCTQQAKSEAEAFSNRRNAIRIEENVGNHVIRQAAKREQQNTQDEALWKQMRREFPKC
jgi:hypothetical protein